MALKRSTIQMHAILSRQFKQLTSTIKATEEYDEVYRREYIYTCVFIGNRNREN